MGRGQCFWVFLPPFGPCRLVSRASKSSASLGFLQPFLVAMFNCICLSSHFVPFSIRLPAVHCIYGPCLGCHYDQIAALLIEYTYILHIQSISIWISHSNKILLGIHWPTRLREICLRPQQQREDIRHQLATPHSLRMTAMIPLLHMVVGRDLQWPRSLPNYLQCGRKICKG